jgi:hypothetical protein
MSSARASARKIRLFASCNAMENRNGILVASRWRHVVGLSPYVREVPKAVGKTEALWRVLNQSRARATKFRITAERLSLRTARPIGARGASPFIGT